MAAAQVEKINFNGLKIIFHVNQIYTEIDFIEKFFKMR